MAEKTILIADSGSTKTDWCLIRNQRKTMYSTQGINPYFMQSEEIARLLHHELKIRTSPDEIHFYGAGISSTDKQNSILKALKTRFESRKIQCHSDILAAARACCGTEKGIVAILGTGSNSCLYNGKKITFKTPSLGYILGDEGGGTQIGRKILQYYLHDIFDENLLIDFRKTFDSTQEEILHQLYQKPFPNRYLAHFTQFAVSHRGHFMIENILEDTLNELFMNHLLRYPGIHKTPVSFCGSVAFYFKDILINLCAQYEIPFGNIVQKPIAGLIHYHRKNM